MLPRHSLREATTQSAWGGGVAPHMNRGSRMLSRLYQRALRAHPEFPIFLLAMVLIAYTDSAFGNTFNNYLSSQFHIGERERGGLEFWRELPGLAVVFMMGILASFTETRVAAIAAAAGALGFLGLIGVGHIWFAMIVSTVIRSTGEHLMMPVRSSIGIWLGGEHERGKRLGQISAAGVVGSILGAFTVLGIFHLTTGQALPSPQSPVGQPIDLQKWQFDIVFWIGAAAAAVAGILLLRMRNVGSRAERPAFVFKRKYWLYYVMHMLFGARKQVFITFGYWVLVKVYGQTPATFAMLSIVGSFIGLFFNPLLGRLVDRLGERTVLVSDAAIQVVFCLGYAFAGHLGLSGRGPLAVVCACFVIDQLMFTVGIARDSYLSKIADDHADVAASISLGTSINHIISMVIPFFGALLWEHTARTQPVYAIGSRQFTLVGHEPVFLVAAGLAVVIGYFSSLVRTPDRRGR